MKKPRIEEAKNSKNEEAQEWRTQEPRSQEEPKNHKNNFKYFTIFNISLFYKPFSTTSKSI